MKNLIKISQSEKELLDRAWSDHPVFGPESYGELFNRYGLKRTSNGLYILYHGTPKENNLTYLRTGSYLADSEKDAGFFAARDRGLNIKKDIKVLTVLVKPDEVEITGGFFVAIKDIPLNRDTNTNYYG